MNEKLGLTRREFLERVALSTAAIAFSQSDAGSAEHDELPVSVIQQRAEWRRFIILVWQWQNDVQRDLPLYEAAGLRGFHIDHGVEEEEKVRFSLQRKFPYYVDHAAGKGILYLQKDVQASISRRASLQVRPNSLADPATINRLKALLRENVATTKKGLVYGYAFDDEISLGAFNNPVEVDSHPLSIAWYRKWLEQRYSSVMKLNRSWGTNYGSFTDIEPAGFDDVRKGASRPPFSSWNLSRWMEWRHFMDYQFAQVLSDLTRFTNTLDLGSPAGFVGGQQPSAYGGYDYALLSRAVQWMEARDFGGTNEILRSFWNRPRRVQVQTFDAAFPHKRNVWVLWHRLAHGNQATIAWPEAWMRDGASGKRELSPTIERLAPTFQEIQGRVSEFITDPASYLETDPIGIYYSHPSIRAGWAMDSIVHGASWPNRLTDIDDANLSSAHLRFSWCKLLEDLGYQYEFVSYLDTIEGRTDLGKRFRVIILPQTVCISDREAQVLRQFVAAGGMLIADNLCGVLTETGRGRSPGVLDDLFSVIRDESKGYLNGQSITEIDAEQFQKPFPVRLHAYNGALQYRSMIVFERGTRHGQGSRGERAGSADVLIRKATNRGQTLYLNLSPLAYHYFPYRSGKVGDSWRETIGRALADAGLKPRVQVLRAGIAEPSIETMLWRNGNRYCLVVLKNISEFDDQQQTLRTLEEAPKEITVRVNFPAKDLRNIRTGKSFAAESPITDLFTPAEANLYEFSVDR